MANSFKTLNSGNVKNSFSSSTSPALVHAIYMQFLIQNINDYFFNENYPKAYRALRGLHFCVSPFLDEGEERNELLKMFKDIKKQTPEEESRYNKSLVSGKRGYFSEDYVQKLEDYMLKIMELMKIHDLLIPNDTSGVRGF